MGVYNTSNNKNENEQHIKQQIMEVFNTSNSRTWEFITHQIAKKWEYATHQIADDWSK